MAKKAVYEFLGYKVQKVIINRANDTLIDSLSFAIEKDKYNAKSKIHEIFIKISIKFLDEEESNVFIKSGFKINDDEWYKNLEKPQINSLFFSVVFPFIRKFISDVTDDARGQVLIPTLDLRNVDMKKGLVLKNDTPVIRKNNV